MQKREVAELDSWLEKRRIALRNTPIGLRPTKQDKSIASRSFAKRLALAKACKKAWDDAIASGRIKKTSDGFELCWILKALRKLYYPERIYKNLY